jgi:galactose oxidase
VLVLAGSYVDATDGKTKHTQPQVWSDGAWTTMTPFQDETLDLYPRTHVISDGRVLISGPLQDTWLFDPAAPPATPGGTPGAWISTGAQQVGQLDYAPAVMYGEDKIVYIGGGVPPTSQAWTIDCSGKVPLQWKATRGDGAHRKSPGVLIEFPHLWAWSV